MPSGHPLKLRRAEVTGEPARCWSTRRARERGELVPALPSWPHGTCNCLSWYEMPLIGATMAATRRRASAHADPRATTMRGERSTHAMRRTYVTSCDTCCICKLHAGTRLDGGLCAQARHLQCLRQRPRSIGPARWRLTPLALCMLALKPQTRPTGEPAVRERE
jgi:hypothetical protein